MPQFAGTHASHFGSSSSPALWHFVRRRAWVVCAVFSLPPISSVRNTAAREVLPSRTVQLLISSASVASRRRCFSILVTVHSPGLQHVAEHAVVQPRCRVDRKSTRLN